MQKSTNIAAIILRPYKLINCGYDFGAPGMKLEIWKYGLKQLEHYSSMGEVGLKQHIKNYTKLGFKLIRSNSLEVKDCKKVS